MRRNRSLIAILSWVQKNTTYYIFIPLFIFSVTAFTVKAQENKITIHFENRAGEKPLQTDSVYTNAFDESFTVRNFKYYISNIVLQDDNKTQSFPDAYFLVNDADSSTKQIMLNIILQHITTLHFLLGVDSLKNVSGVQTGDLDPAKGMFWTWNTGYVMAKLEGNSPSANAPQHAFSYHVGGYKQNEKTAREINLILPHTVNCINENCTITITADILKWFNAEHEIKIAAIPFCHEPGMPAIKLADNYAKMFSIADAK